MSEQADGRVIMVTGAASGIGRACVDASLAGGATVVGVDVARVSPAERFHPTRCDVADEASVQRLFDDVSAQHGRLDAIVHVAGVQRAATIEHATVPDWNRQFEVNVRSCFLLSKFGIGLLERSTDPAIVHVASVAGIRGIAGVTGYSASKGAVIAFTRSLARVFAPRGVRVNTLSPGWTDTAFNAPVIAEIGGQGELDALVEGSVPLRRQGRPAEIAAAAIFLAGTAASYITGHNLVVDGGLSC